MAFLVVVATCRKCRGRFFGLAVNRTDTDRMRILKNGIRASLTNNSLLTAVSAEHTQKWKHRSWTRTSVRPGHCSVWWCRMA